MRAGGASPRGLEQGVEDRADDGDQPGHGEEQSEDEAIGIGVNGGGVRGFHAGLVTAPTLRGAWVPLPMWNVLKLPFPEGP